MTKNRIVSLLAKIIIVLFWTSIFLIGLYIPTQLSFFGKRSINVATWTDLIDPRLAQKFYKKTGIKVNISYLEDNYELIQKLKASDGQGYDLVIPSDFAIQKLIQYNLLKPLQKEAFIHWNRINPRLLGNYYDADNTYSIPYHWGLYGLGIDHTFFGATTPKASWDLLFKKPNPYFTVAVIGAPRETILMAALYLFGSLDCLEGECLKQIQQLLIEQKKWVEAYTEFRADYLLLSHACPVVVITTPHIFRLLKITSSVEFLLPQEGGFQVIDSWVIPKGSTKDELTYQFLNFLYESNVIAYHFKKYTFFPATIDLPTLLQDSAAGRYLLAMHQQTKIPLHFFKNVINEDDLNQTWIAVKAS